MSTPIASTQRKKIVGKWKKTLDKKSGRYYFYNSKTKMVSWTKPPEMIEQEQQKLLKLQKKKNIFVNQDVNFNEEQLKCLKSRYTYFFVRSSVRIEYKGLVKEGYYKEAMKLVYDETLQNPLSHTNPYIQNLCKKIRSDIQNPEHLLSLVLLARVLYQRSKKAADESGRSMSRQERLSSMSTSTFESSKGSGVSKNISTTNTSLKTNNTQLPIRHLPSLPSSSSESREKKFNLPTLPSISSTVPPPLPQKKRDLDTASRAGVRVRRPPIPPRPATTDLTGIRGKEGESNGRRGVRPPIRRQVSTPIGLIRNGTVPMRRSVTIGRQPPPRPTQTQPQVQTRRTLENLSSDFRGEKLSIHPRSNNNLNINESESIRNHARMPRPPTSTSHRIKNNHRNDSTKPPQPPPRRPSARPPPHPRRSVPVPRPPPQPSQPKNNENLHLAEPNVDEGRGSLLKQIQIGKQLKKTRKKSEEAIPGPPPGLPSEESFSSGEQTAFEDLSIQSILRSKLEDHRAFLESEEQSSDDSNISSNDSQEDSEFE